MQNSRLGTCMFEICDGMGDMSSVANQALAVAKLPAAELLGLRLWANRQPG